MPNRVVLVTGAAGGIGSAITKSLVGAGHSVAAVDRDAEGLKRLATSERIHPIIADLASEASVTAPEVIGRRLSDFGGTMYAARMSQR